MSWYSIREYTDRSGVSVSTVRRQIREGRLFAKKFGRHWYIQQPDGTLPPVSELKFEEDAFGLQTAQLGSASSSVQSVVDFSSKALHHYLLLSEKLIAEKDLRLKERETELQTRRQEIAELEGYTAILEEEIRRLKERPEGWR
jgi:excisionase family DNA binding protein